MKTLEFEVEIVQPKLIGNFKTLAVALDEYTKQFEIEVTSSNLSEAKSSSAEINKIKKQVKDTAKKYLEEVEAPIKLFKQEVTKIEQLLEDKRLVIVSGVNVFEDAKRLEHTQVMQEYLKNSLNGVELREEFKNTISIPSPSVAGLTTKGELLKKFKDEIDSNISKALEFQRLRDIEQENQRLRDEARAVEIANEMRIKEQLAYKAPEPVPVVEEDNGLFNQEPTREEAPQQQAPTPPSVDGKSVYKITLEFEVQSKSGIDCEAMLDKVLPMIYAKQIPIASKKCEEE